MLVRKGTNVETHMFGVHTEIVSEPFIDALQEMNGYSSSSADPVQVYLRALLSSDGGLTQLKSITSDASLNRKVKHNETQLKIGTNSSTTPQPY